MITAYVGLGSNLGDRLGNLSRAIDAVAHVPDTHVTKVSRAYESEAAYLRDQPPFLNAVIELETDFEAHVLFDYLQSIEDEMGRVREVENGPRLIDLDLLLFGDEEISTDVLTLPHPGLLERDFVLTPLLEIAMQVELPSGEIPRRSEGLQGRVIRDYGRIPDAGAAHNMPIEETEWVTVAESEGPQSALGGFDAGLELARQALAQEGIPYAFEPFEPGLDTDFLGRPRVFKLGVPIAYERQAVELLEALEEAPFVEPTGDVTGTD
jgi:2-amino-4-hydroxy-6-hydroxymethyldihydropteridine diphosphokinase